MAPIGRRCKVAKGADLSRILIFYLTNLHCFNWKITVWHKFLDKLKHFLRSLQEWSFRGVSSPAIKWTVHTITLTGRKKYQIGPTPSSPEDGNARNWPSYPLCPVWRRWRLPLSKIRCGSVLDSTETPLPPPSSFCLLRGSCIKISNGQIRGFPLPFSRRHVPRHGTTLFWW